MTLSVVTITPTGTLEIPTPLEKAVGTHFHARHGTKTALVFLPVDEEASTANDPYFQVRSPYYQAARCNHKTPIPVFSR